VAGAFVLLRNGEPVIYVERGGKGLLQLGRMNDEQRAAALAAIVEAVRERRLPRLGIERIDGETIVGHALEAELVDAGFERQPRRLVASA
jgi:ATP-dependent Lhr-like helicase